MMEEYVARDSGVEFAMRGRRAACDVYVASSPGPGHVPSRDNPKGSP